MWLFTKIGFYSVVCAKLDGGKGPVDPSRLMVRARDLQHLHALQATFPNEFVEPLRESDHTDYPARLFIDKTVFAERVMPRLAQMISYGNFKSELTRTGQHKYHDACSSVWGIMLRLQAPRRRSSAHPEFEFDRDDEPLRQDRDTWWHKRGRNRGADRVDAPKVSPRVEVESEPEPAEIVPARVAPLANGRKHGPDDVIVVGEWAAGGAIKEHAVLTNVEHYRRGRVAMRDAAARGWCPLIPRSRLSLRRLSPAEADQLVPNLPRHSMAGVLPSVGEQRG